MNNQLLPRLIVALLAVLFVYNFAEAPRKDSDVSSRKIGFKPLVAAFVGVAVYLLASRVHWYPATDGTGTP